MNLPFSQDQFFLVFRLYNEGVWPAQILLNILAITLIGLSLRKFPNGSRIISIVLGIFWLWMGIVYHVGFFSSINPAAYFFGAGFAVQGILLFWIGSKNRVRYQWRRDGRGIAGAFLVGFALILYPLLGYFQNHTYPASPTFGLPCPTTIFTFGIFLWSSGLPRVTLVIPGLWSLIGFFAALSLGVLEDIGLLISALIALPIILMQKSEMREVVQ